METAHALPTDRSLPALEAIRMRGPGVLLVPGTDLHGAVVRLCGHTRGRRATLEVRMGDQRFAITAMADDPRPSAVLYRRLQKCCDRCDVMVPPLLACHPDLRIIVTG